MADYSFIILTYNEEMHLPRLLLSIKDLGAPIFIIDSGSTDKTIEIAKEYGATVISNKFINHPVQWQFALDNLTISTPWIIGLDADQIVSEELFQKLNTFKDENFPRHINGIYFNRKNYFRGKWINHGGYFPKYLLKMF